MLTKDIVQELVRGLTDENIQKDGIILWTAGD